MSVWQGFCPMNLITLIRTESISFMALEISCNESWESLRIWVCMIWQTMKSPWSLKDPWRRVKPLHIHTTFLHRHSTYWLRPQPKQLVSYTVNWQRCYRSFTCKIKQIINNFSQKQNNKCINLKEREGYVCAKCYTALPKNAHWLNHRIKH